MTFATPPPAAPAPEQTVEPCLEVLKSGKRVEKHALAAGKDSWIIGRALDQVAIGCQHESISRQHAAVTLQNGQWFLTDLGSAHGTFLQGQKLPKNTPVRIESGANIKFGVSSR